MIITTLQTVNIKSETVVFTLGTGCDRNAQSLSPSSVEGGC